MVILDRFNGNCKTLNDLLSRKSVPSKKIRCNFKCF